MDTILTFIPGQGIPDLATWSCAADFGGAAPSSCKRPLSSTLGKGIFPLYSGTVAAALSPGLNMGQVCRPASSCPGFALCCLILSYTPSTLQNTHTHTHTHFTVMTTSGFVTISFSKAIYKFCLVTCICIFILKYA